MNNGVFCKKESNYFNSTLAPAASNLALIASASSLVAPSFTVLGAPSTKSLASFKPKFVIPRISLITLILLAPASAKITSNSVFSSTAAAPAAAPAPATATAAAAETPHFSYNIFDNSAASITVRADNSSTNLAKSAIFLLQLKIKLLQIFYKNHYLIKQIIKQLLSRYKL